MAVVTLGVRSHLTGLCDITRVRYVKDRFMVGRADEGKERKDWRGDKSKNGREGKEADGGTRLRTGGWR